jgi:hypothetical protein
VEIEKSAVPSKKIPVPVYAPKDRIGHAEIIVDPGLARPASRILSVVQFTAVESRAYTIDDLILLGFAKPGPTPSRYRFHFSKLCFGNLFLNFLRERLGQRIQI